MQVTQKVTAQIILVEPESQRDGAWAPGLFFCTNGLLKISQSLTAFYFSYSYLYHLII
jgi:hypothetical protein